MIINHIYNCYYYIFYFIVHYEYSIANMPKQIYNKQLIVDAYNNKKDNHLTNTMIMKLFNISNKTIYNYVNDDNLTDEIKRYKVPFPQKINDFIINYAINNHNFNFKKLRMKIKSKFNYYIKKNKLYNVLRDNNLSYKRANIKNTSIKTQRSLNDIKDLHNKITLINGDSKDNIIFTDEVHFNLDDVKNYGWNYKNKEVTFKKNSPSNIINKRFTVIASVSRKKKIGYTIIKDSCNAEKYKKHVKKISRISNQKYHYQDGARIHTAKIIKNTMQRLGIKIIQGIPYTPELNIIEYFFNVLKKKFKNIDLSKRHNIRNTIRKCWNSIDDQFLENTYNHVYDNIEFCNRCV